MKLIIVLFSYLNVLIEITRVDSAKLASITNYINKNSGSASASASVQSGVDSMSSSNEKQILFYYVDNDKGLYTIDKMNKISLLNIINPNDRSIEIINEKTFERVGLSSSDNQKHKLLPKLFSLIYSNEKYLLIGSLNGMVNISLANLNSPLNNKPLNNEIFWPKSKTRNECFGFVNKTNAFVCQNYIRVGIPLLNDSLVILCGTNSSQPFCRKYKLESTGLSSGLDDPMPSTSSNLSTFSLTTNYANDELKSKLIEEFQSPQLITFNLKLSANNLFDTHDLPPFVHQNSIYNVYSGSYTQLSSIEKHILVETHSNSNVKVLTTVKTPVGALKNSNFRSSFPLDDKIYFLFVENELTYDNTLVFTKPNSFISEICANDNGRVSVTYDNSRFLSFKKTLIYCYLPDSKSGFHVKYTEIESVTKPIRRLDNGNEIFYGIFTFRRFNKFDSALCKFEMSDVKSAMSGNFKLEHNSDQVVYKRPLESCDMYKDANEYYKETMKYYKFQMEQSINEQAVFQLNDVRFTSIAVDTANSNNNYNVVIFIGTNDGRVFKLLLRSIQINSMQKLNYTQTIIIQEYQLFDQAPVNNLIIYNEQQGSRIQTKLVAISDEEIKSILMDVSCESHITCSQCVGSQDPYCVWSLSRKKCVSSSLLFDHGESDDQFLRDVLNGNTSRCSTNNNDDFNHHSHQNNEDSTEYPNSDYGISYSIRTQAIAANNFMTQKINENNPKTNGHGHDQAEFTADARSRIDTTSIRPKYNKQETLLIAIILTAFLTCLVSVLLTWLFIKKRYKMADYVAKHLMSSSKQNQSNRLSASSTTSYNYNSKKFIHKDELEKKFDSKHKCQNFYETPSNATGNNNNKKPLPPLLASAMSSTGGVIKSVGLMDSTNLKTSSKTSRHNSATDSPTTTTTSTVSSSESNHHSPNGGGGGGIMNSTTPTKYKPINDVLSSSDDSFEPHPLLPPERTLSNHNRYPKRAYASSLPINTKPNRANQTETVNITTNLLNSQIEPPHDSSV